MTQQSSHIKFNPDGSITETTSNSTKNTVFNTDGSITDSMTVVDEGGLISQKTTNKTVFNEDGSIDNVVSIENI